MKLEFVNHASFILSEGDVTLLMDPWIEGSVFDNSWSLLMPSFFKFSDFSRITHIWISHEHPDHFFPPNLKKINPEVRSKIAILFKKTDDRKVLNFCINLGFTVIELTDGKWHSLSDTVSVNCLKWYDDSLLMVQTSEHNILNVNDCVLSRRKDVESILKKLGKKVDYLFTQYSYASYVGETYEDRRQCAKDKFDEISIQIDIIKPKCIFPFASNVYFSHVENFEMNDAVNTMRDVYNFIGMKYPEIDIVVLKPGSLFEPNSNYDNAKVLEDYDHEYLTLPFKTKYMTNKVDVDILGKCGMGFIDRLKKLKFYQLLNLFGIVKQLYICVPDVNRKYKLSLTEFSRVDDNVQCDIQISSDALRFCFLNDYGFNTLQVNGRFKVLQVNGLTRLNKFTSLGDAMNHERSGYSDFIKALFRRILSNLN